MMDKIPILQRLLSQKTWLVHQAGSLWAREGPSTCHIQKKGGPSLAAMGANWEASLVRAGGESRRPSSTRGTYL